MNIVPRILFVEDFDIQRSIYEAMASRMHVDLAFAASGGQAVQLVSTSTFDLVVLDWNLPDMNALTCAKQMHEQWQQGGVKPPKVVCMTACPVDDDREQALAAGFDDYVGKPFGIDDFASVLNSWITVVAHD